MTGRDDPRGGASASTPSRCGRCGADYPPPAFTDLAPVRTFTSDDLTAHVVRWPEGTVVDVRACSRCAAPIARLTRPAP